MGNCFTVIRKTRSEVWYWSFYSEEYVKFTPTYALRSRELIIFWRNETKSFDSSAPMEISFTDRCRVMESTSSVVPVFSSWSRRKCAFHIVLNFISDISVRLLSCSQPLSTAILTGEYREPRSRIRSVSKGSNGRCVVAFRRCLTASVFRVERLECPSTARPPRGRPVPARKTNPPRGWTSATPNCLTSRRRTGLRTGASKMCTCRPSSSAWHNRKVDTLSTRTWNIFPPVNLKIVAYAAAVRFLSVGRPFSFIVRCCICSEVQCSAKIVPRVQCGRC